MFKLLTNKPVALDSPDHIDPQGAVMNNTGDPLFNELLYKLWDHKISIIDMGCAGGAFIIRCHEDGNLAVGLEGSDAPVKRGLYNWPHYKDKNLFNCDVTEPFMLLLDDQQFLCDCITSWEFLEHIAIDKIDVVLQNTINHLKDGGLYVCSISSGTQTYCDSIYGKLWGAYSIFKNAKFNHQNQNTPEWWDKKFAEFGFIRRDDLRARFGGRFIRGPGYGCADWATEERIQDVVGMAPEKQECNINRVYQLKRK